MIHFLGVLLLSLTVAFCGVYPTVRLLRRQSQLEMSISCISEMREAVRYSGTNSKRLTDSMREKYSELDWLWEKHLRDESYCIGREFLQGFGKGDTESQLNYCDMYMSRFKKILKSVEKDKDGKTRLYLSLGAMSGIGVFIMLI